MVSPLAPQADDLSARVDSYERARRATGRARVRDHLPPRDHPGYNRVLAELVRVDLEYAWDAGNGCEIAEYLAEFPELAAARSLLGGVALEEYRQRLNHGDRPRPEEYRERYGVSARGWPQPEPAAAENHEPTRVTGPAVAAARSYRAFRETAAPADNFLATLRSPLADEAARVFNELHKSDPLSADRLAAAVEAFPEVGAEFAGFRLVSELGRGAFGRVYLAEQDELANRRVALKVAADLTGEPQTLAQLQHTNIVPVYSVHRRGPLQAVCMPYFGATTLADVIGDLRRAGSVPGSGHQIVSTLNNRRHSTQVDSGVRSAPSVDHHAPHAPPESHAAHEILDRLTHLPYVEAVFWLASRLADGLAHAHERGVIHRDLKPANVLLTDEGQPMLLDFNLADAATGTAAVAAKVGGTLPYMAPEHLDAFRGAAAKVDARSDVYSLGLVLFELLTGRHPFPTPSGPVHRILPEMAARRRRAAPRVRPLNPGVSPAAEAVVRKCLAPDPADRYPTARQLQEDIDLHLAHRPLKHAPNPSARERAAKFAKRHPRLSSAGAVGTLAAVLLVGLGGALFAATGQLAARRAESAAAAFRADAREVALGIGVGTTDVTLLDRNLTDARRALARFGVLTDPDWHQKPDVARLAESDRARLRTEVGELLFLTARATALHAERATGSAAADRLAEAVSMSERAVACFPPDQVPRAVAAQADELRRLLAGDVSARPPAAELLPPNPSARDAHLAAADLVLRRRYTEALKYAQHAVAAAPDSVQARFVLGNCLDGLGEDAKAEAQFDACVALAPDFGWPRFNRGRSRQLLRNHAGAEADFAKVLELRPELWDARVARGRARLDLGRPAEAAADFTAALRQAGPKAHIFLLRSVAHDRLGDKAAARADYDAGFRTPADGEADWALRGGGQADRDPAAAAEAFDRALAANPLSREATENKALLLAEPLGRPADAVRMLDDYLAGCPGNARARAARATAHARVGNRPAAAADADDVLKRTRDPAVLYAVARVYAVTGRDHPADAADAIRWLGVAWEAGYGREKWRGDGAWDGVRETEPFHRLARASGVTKFDGGGR